jgi:hypothetical protein
MAAYYCSGLDGYQGVVGGHANTCGMMMPEKTEMVGTDCSWLQSSVSVGW